MSNPGAGVGGGLSLTETDSRYIQQNLAGGGALDTVYVRQDGSENGVFQPGVGVTLRAPSGGDDLPNIRAAFLVSSDVLLGPGTWNFGSHDASGMALGLPSGARLRGCGRGRTTLQPQTGVNGAINFAVSGPDQLVHDIEVTDLTLDGQFMSSTTNGWLIGNLLGFQYRTSFQNIFFRRINTVNMPTTATATTANINIQSTHQTSGQTASFIARVVCDDVDFSGGNQGVIIWSNVDDHTSANCLIDQIHFTGHFRHDCVTTTGQFGAHIQIGQYAMVGTVVVEGMPWGNNSSDVGFEFDNVRDLRASDLYARDFANAALYIRNIGYAVGSAGIPYQLARVRSIIGENLSRTSPVAVLGMEGNTSPTAYGDVEIGSVHYRHGLTTYGSAPAAVFLKQSAFNRVKIDSVVHEMNGVTDLTHRPTLNAVYIIPDGSGTVDIGTVETRWTNSNINTLTTDVLVTDNNQVVTLQLTINELIVNHTGLVFNGTGGEQAWFSCLATNALKLSLLLVLRGIRILAAGTPSLGGVRVHNSTQITLLKWSTISDARFTGQTGGTEINFDTSAGVSSNAVNARLRDIIYRTGSDAAKPQSVAITATGTTVWQNTTGMPVIFKAYQTTSTITSVAVSATGAFAGEQVQVAENSEDTATYVESGWYVQVVTSGSANGRYEPVLS